MRWRKPLPRNLPKWPVMRLIWGDLVAAKRHERGHADGQCISCLHCHQLIRPERMGDVCAGPVVKE